jgi:hypothetical protein
MGLSAAGIASRIDRGLRPFNIPAPNVGDATGADDTKPPGDRGGANVDATALLSTGCGSGVDDAGRSAAGFDRPLRPFNIPAPNVGPAAGSADAADAAGWSDDAGATAALLVEATALLSAGCAARFVSILCAASIPAPNDAAGRSGDAGATTGLSVAGIASRIDRGLRPFKIPAPNVGTAIGCADATVFDRGADVDAAAVLSAG